MLEESAWSVIAMARLFKMYARLTISEGGIL
jgi:hypothetical protein